MKDDLEALVALLRNPPDAEVYRERCRRALALEEQLESIARQTGIPIWQARRPNLDPRTHVGVSFELGKFIHERF